MSRAAQSWSRETELSVLGGMFLDSAALKVARSLTTQGAFFGEGHRKVFAAMERIDERGDVVEYAALHAELEAAGELKAAGGAVFIAELFDAVVTSANIEAHIGRLNRLAYVRNLAAAAATIAQEADEAGTREAEDIHAIAVEALASVAPVASSSSIVRIQDLLWPRMEALEGLGKGQREPTISTGLAALDDKLGGGLRRRKMSVVAGRPSMGKSAVANCNILAEAAIRQGLRVAIWSPDADKESVVDRLLQSESRVNIARAKRRGGLHEDEMPRLGMGAGFLHNAKIHIDDTPSPTPDQVRAGLRRIERDHGKVDLVIWDYLQQMSAPQFKDPRQAINYISGEAKKIPREFDCAMLALAQLSRAVEARPDRRPMMSDLKESGNIEQDADVIVLLFRPEYYFGPEMEVGKGKDKRIIDISGKAEAIVAKNKDGETGSVPLLYVPEYTRFENAA